MKKKAMLNVLMIAVAIIPAIYLGIIWAGIPEIVPVHFGIDMKPDKMGSKDGIWMITGIFTFIAIATYFLMSNIHRFDPKRKASPQPGVFNKMGAGLLVFITALNMVMILSMKGNMVLQNLLFPLLGLLFAFLGNYMVNIKPNYFAGFRLPWTLHNDENWRKTHQLAGKIWFAGGLLITIISLFLPPHLLLPFFIGITVILVIIPAVYSYRIFKNGSVKA